MSRIAGTVKWFNDSKGYGFLEVAEPIKSPVLSTPTALVFAHYTAIETDGFKTLAEGQSVTFDLLNGPKGPQAASIRAVLS